MTAHGILMALIPAVLLLIALGLRYLRRSGDTTIGSIQDLFVGFESIDNDVIRMENGELRAVLEVGTINFDLLADEEARAVIDAWGGALNNLAHPLQIIVHIDEIALVAFQAELIANAEREPSELLSDLTRDFLHYLRLLLRSQHYLDRRVYVVVPSEPYALERATGLAVLLPHGRRQGEQRSFAARLRDLDFRVEEVQASLAGCTLPSRRLDTAELVSLMRACWHAGDDDLPPGRARGETATLLVEGGRAIDPTARPFLPAAVIRPPARPATPTRPTTPPLRADRPSASPAATARRATAARRALSTDDLGRR